MKYNKLIRDNIPEIIKAKGGVAITHIASEEEYHQKLLEKLREEVQEFEESENQEEMADILEVIEAICEYKGFSSGEISRIKEEKAEKRGRFRKRIILEES